MRAPLHNRKNTQGAPGTVPPTNPARPDTDSIPDTEELSRTLIRRQVEIWQIDTELQEVLYRGTSPDRRN
jgi:hypothetical protein